MDDGYAESGLSDIALEWMVQKAIDHGVKKHQVQQGACKPHPDGTMHNSRSGFGRLYRRKVRTWDMPHPPTVHRSVTLRTLDRLNRGHPTYSSWILNHRARNIEPWTPIDISRFTKLAGWSEPRDPRTSQTHNQRAKALLAEINSLPMKITAAEGDELKAAIDNNISP